MFDLEAKPISALVFEIQLNIVVFPVLERPIIPQLSAIMMRFYFACKLTKKVRNEGRKDKKRDISEIFA
jgi:hypothetical protein